MPGKTHFPPFWLTGTMSYFPRFIPQMKESLLKDADGIYDEFSTPEKAAESVKLKVCNHLTWMSLMCLVVCNCQPFVKMPSYLFFLAFTLFLSPIEESSFPFPQFTHLCLTFFYFWIYFNSHGTLPGSKRIPIRVIKQARFIVNSLVLKGIHDVCGHRRCCGGLYGDD